MSKEEKIRLILAYMDPPQKLIASLTKSMSRRSEVRIDRLFTHWKGIAEKEGRLK